MPQLMHLLRSLGGRDRRRRRAPGEARAARRRRASCAQHAPSRTCDRSRALRRESRSRSNVGRRRAAAGLVGACACGQSTRVMFYRAVKHIGSRGRSLATRLVGTLRSWRGRRWRAWSLATMRYRAGTHIGSRGRSRSGKGYIVTLARAKRGSFGATCPETRPGRSRRRARLAHLRHRVE